MENNFIPGLKLAELFFEDVVKEIINTYFPKLRYTAALIGPSSEVLEYDDVVSSDHHWGLRLQLFLSGKDHKQYSKELNEIFRKKLPYEYKGYSTHWSEPDPEDNNTQMPEKIQNGEVNHRIDITTTKHYLKKLLDITSLKLTEKDWLLLPDQALLEFTSGKIFFDNLGELKVARKTLNYFPDNVWKYKILSEWEHIDQEKAFAGRTGEVGDEMGSKIEASRLIRYIMKLALILNKQYVPYEKWFGTAFSKLSIAAELEPILLQILNEQDWKKRDVLLCEAYILLVKEQNKLKITPEISIKPVPYFHRNQIVVDTKYIMEELSKQIKPPLNKLKLLGTVDQLLLISGGLTTETAKKAKQFYH